MLSVIGFKGRRLSGTVLLAAIAAFWVSAAEAYEPGSGLYAADCEAPGSAYSLAIAGDGTAEVKTGGAVFRDLLTSYSFFGDSTPPDFHIAVLFSRDFSPLPAVDGQPGWLEIWRGEAAYYALLNGDRSRQLYFCRDLEETASPGPSFPCDKASGEVESLICEDGELARQDRAVAAAYEKAKGRIAGDAAEAAQLKAEQIGWIKGRNDCWKADDVRACVSARYSDRHAILLARYGLIEAGETEVWICKGAAGPLYVTRFMTEPETVNLVLGDEATTAVRRIAASGVRYEAPFGRQFWMKGRAAMLKWRPAESLDCHYDGVSGD
jgi:uncharacterized protein